MNRRDFLTSVAVTVATLVAGLKPERGGHVTEMAAIDTEGFISPPRSQTPCQGCYRQDTWCDYSDCPYGYGTYEAFKDPQLHCLLPVSAVSAGGVTIFVAADGSDGNDGLSWDTRVRTLSHAIGLMRTGDKCYVGPVRHRDYVVLD